MILRNSNLFVLVVVLLGWTTEATILFQPNNSACKKQSGALFCNFEGLNENIELGDIDSGLVKFRFTTITIHNANSIAVSSALCYDVNFKNIGKIHFERGYVGCKDKVYSMFITDSAANRIPRKLSKLNVINSHIESITADLGLQRLYITKSNIGDLNVPWPVGGVAYLTIEHTTINNIVKLNIQERVTLNLYNTTISNLGPDGISVGSGASLHMIDCTLNKGSTTAVVLKPGAKLTVNNLVGSLTTISKSPDKGDIEGRRPPGVPALKPLSPDEEKLEPELIDLEECLCGFSSYWWIIPTVIAFGEALVILYVYGTDKRPKLIKNASRTDSETGYDNFNVNVQRSSTPYDSNYRAGPQFPNAPPLRRR